jgi:hypothetical protein
MSRSYTPTARLRTLILRLVPEPSLVAAVQTRVAGYLDVVVTDPDIESSLHLLDRVEAALGEELLAHRLVEALDLAGRRRCIRSGE